MKKQPTLICEAFVTVGSAVGRCGAPVAYTHDRDGRRLCRDCGRGHTPLDATTTVPAASVSRYEANEEIEL